MTAFSLPIPLISSLYGVLAIFGLGLLIFVHELGHFVSAKASGVTVHEFVLGFGPKIVAVKRGETTYGIAVIPLGGYVKMAGSELGGPEEEPNGFSSAAVWKRLIIVFTGPAANWVLAVLLAIALLMGSGIFVPTTVVNKALPGSAAEGVGLRPGDRIVSLGGTKINNWDQATKIIRSRPGQAVGITVDRGGRLLHLTARLGKSHGHGFLGVEIKVRRERLGPVRATIMGVSFTAAWTKFIVVTVYQLIKKGLFLKQARSPIGAVVEGAKAVRTGWQDYAIMLASLSIFLAIVNLAPLPPLDGGRLLMVLIEAIRGRPVSFNVQVGIQAVGLVLLLSLMVYLVSADIQRYLLPQAARFLSPH